jgi:hypothetical protein
MPNDEDIAHQREGRSWVGGGGGVNFDVVNGKEYKSKNFRIWMFNMSRDLGTVMVTPGYYPYPICGFSHPQIG